MRVGRHEKAGELYARLREYQAAMRCYQAGGAFQKALDVAREQFPGEVVRLEEEWGNYLVTQRQLDAAINHFIEAGYGSNMDKRFIFMAYFCINIRGVKPRFVLLILSY